MTHARPAPLAPPDLDVSHLPWMRLVVDRLLDSDWWISASWTARGVAVELWCHAWKQVPAGSIPDTDAWIAKKLGMAREEWAGLREEVLSAWTLCADGRWHHATVVEMAVEARAAWLANERASAERRAKASKAAQARHAKRRAQDDDEGGGAPACSGTAQARAQAVPEHVPKQYPGQCPEQCITEHKEQTTPPAPPSGGLSPPMPGQADPGSGPPALTLAAPPDPEPPPPQVKRPIAEWPWDAKLEALALDAGVSPHRLADEWQKFRDYWAHERSKKDRTKPYTGLTRTWATWCRNAAKDEPPRARVSDRGRGAPGGAGSGNPVRAALGRLGAGG